MQRSANSNAPGLIRALGLWSAIAVIVGSMIGQAVFLVASDMARELGSPTRVLAVWIISGIVVLFGAFCYAELGAAIPEAGGDYVYLSRGLTPVWGFLYGWTSSTIMRPGSAAEIGAALRGIPFDALELPEQPKIHVVLYRVLVRLRPPSITLTCREHAVVSLIKRSEARHTF